MENIFIAIVTDDKEYARSLSLAMLNVCRGFIIRIFSAEEFLAADREYDIVLWDGEEVSRVYGGRIIYLAEKASDVAKSAAEKRFSIYKYSPAASMVAGIFEIYETLTGRHAVNLKSQDVRLFAFSSCTGGAGCTTMAMAAAQELCRFQGKKVLYLSFEELDSAGCYFNYETGIRGTAVYLYELFNKLYMDKSCAGGNYQGAPFLDKHIVRDDYGVESFAPATGRNPLRELNPGEINRFMASLIDSGRFDAIIMDMGQWISKAGLKCMELAEKIFMVTDRYETCSRYDQYVSHMVENCGEDILDKMIRIINKYDDGSSDDGNADNSTDEKILHVRKSESFIKDDKRIRIILEGDFGSDINMMADRMIEPL